MNIRWEAAGASDVGRVRRGNEDALFLDEEQGVFLVADGMGGHAAGEVASGIAAAQVGSLLVETVRSGNTDDAVFAALRESVRKTQSELVRHGSAHPETRGMGTTLTACNITAAGRFQLGHVGDSRAYLLRDGELSQLTVDHTWVQEEVNDGRLTPEAAARHQMAHVLTRVLSTDTEEQPDLIAGNSRVGDVFLLATDGLTGMVDDDKIAAILRENTAPEDIAGALIEAANDSGGVDNITAVVVRILPG